jgi:hypothetical protein
MKTTLLGLAALLILASGTGALYAQEPMVSMLSPANASLCPTAVSIASDSAVTIPDSLLLALTSNECPDLACFPSLSSCLDACTDGVCERRINCGGPTAHKCFCPH